MRVTRQGLLVASEKARWQCKFSFFKITEKVQCQFSKKVYGWKALKYTYTWYDSFSLTPKKVFGIS